MTPEKLAQLQQNRGFFQPDMERRKNGIASDFEFASKIDPEETQEQLDGRMARILTNTDKGDPAADPMLKSYRKYRESRGEKPLQYLDAYSAGNRSKKLGEQIPFFAKMFRDFSSAFPPEKRASVEADFAGSPQADMAKKSTANKMLVAAMVDQPVQALEANWPVTRTMYAKQALGWDKDGVIPEDEFHSLAGSMLNTEESNRTKTTNVANRARASIMKGEDSEKFIKGLPTEYQKVATEVQTDFLSKFDDTEIALAKALFQRDISDQAEDENAGVDLEGVYNSLSLDRKDAVRGLMGILAQDQGWDVQGFFARTYAASKDGAVRVARGAVSTNEEGRADFLQWYADRGTIFTPEELKDTKTIDHLYESWIGLRRGGPGAIAAYEKDVAAKTPEGSKETLGGMAKHARSRAAYLADMATAGIHTDRFMREQEDGFWMRSWLLASGSLAETGLALLPAGTGLPIIMGSRKAEAKSNFQRIAPNADADTIDGMATVAALGQTATLGMERFILGARLPKTTRSLAALETGLTNMALRGGWRTAVAFVPRAGLVVGLEMIQENTENMIPHMVQALASGLNQDVPGVNWDKVFKDQKEIQGDIFGASLIFGIIGGGGRTIGDYVQGPKLREALADTAGMRLSGLSAQDAADVNAMAERNPLDAAEEYRKRMASTPDEVKRANVVAEKMRQQREVNDGETMRRAGLPQMSQDESGRVVVKWNDIMDNESTFSTPEEAQEAISQRESQAATDLSRMNRQELLGLISGDAEAEIARLQSGLPSNVRLQVDWVESQTFAEWAGNDSARINQARERIRLYMQAARNDMGAVINDSDIDLNEWVYQGSSRNLYEGGITTIAVNLAKGGKIINGKMTDPASALTVLEEVAEGLSKHFRSQGVTLDRQAGWVRTIEQGTKQAMLPKGFESMSPEAKALAVDEALSDIAMGYAIGRVADENVPSGLLNFLKAFRELFGAVLRLAKGISKFFKDGGTVDPEFQTFLDTAAGLTEPTAVAEAQIQAIDEVASQAASIAEAMTGDGRTFAVQPQNIPLVEGEPLRGLTGGAANIDVPGRGVVKFGPFETARRAAKTYVESSGLVYDPPGTYAKVDRRRAERIAAAFDAMEHNPQDPEVKASYDAMIQETLAQWEVIKATGLKVEVNPPGVDPYAASPRLAILDVVENNHLYFFPTFEGFGSSDADISGNPLLEPTGEVLEGGHVMVANDVFRIVHDYFGHIKEGVGFRADGEENAWRSHSAMYSPLARRAMTTETRGQNSWVNFGPHGEANRKAGAGETVFADQKIGLLPEWVSYEAAGDPGTDIARDVADGKTSIEGTTFSVRAWHGTPHTFDSFDTSFMGTGEGAQAYGWGLYFAENRSVGEHYRDMLAPDPEINSIRIGGVQLYSNGYAVDYSPYQFTNKPGKEDYGRAWLQEQFLIEEFRIREAYRKGGNEAVIAEAKAMADEYLKSAETDEDWGNVTVLKDMIRKLNAGIGTKIDINLESSNLYEVTLDFTEDQALHFEKPLAKQSKFIKEKLKAAGVLKEFKENMDNFASPQNTRGAGNGDNLYNFLSWKLGGDQEASLYLAGIGIPALAHYNSGTRTLRSKENNYVVFDGKHIKIESRNGDPVVLPDDTFAVANMSGMTLVESIEAQITDPGTKSAIWTKSRDRIAEIQERYNDKPNPSRWISVEEQEQLLLDIDERRQAEFERHDTRLQEIEMDLSSATQEARAGLMAELGNRFEEANASHRNSLRRLTREREEVVRQKHLRLRDQETNAHKKNLQALDNEERELMDRGRKTDRERNRFQQVRDIATLEAIGKALPASIRGLVVPSFKKITDMTKASDREAYIRDLVPKLDDAIEKHLKREFGKAIERRLESGKPVVSDSRTATGKIGAAGHDLFKLAEAAKSIKPEDLDARIQEIQDKIDAMTTVDMEELERLDTEMAVIEAFYDYENASSYRLENALELMNEIYVTGRKEWLDVLASRKERQLYIVSTLAAGLGVDDVNTADRVAAVRKSEGLVNRVSEGFMAALLSGHQTIRRLGELTEDPEVKAVLETFERDLYDAETAEQDGNERDQKALAAALRSILKVSTDYSMAKRLRELTDGSQADVPITRVEGATPDTEIKVPIKFVESIVRGETQGFTMPPRKNQISDPKEVTLTDDQVDLLRQEWFDFQQLDEEDRKGARSITITDPGAKGVRRSLGKLSQLEALQFYLTLQQPDQKENAAKIGYDDTTMKELKAWLKPEVIALGDWMVDYLRADQGNLDAIHRSEKGVGLGLVENYFPIRKDVAGADLGNLDLNGMGAQQSGKSVGFIKARVDNTADIAIANAVGVFMAHRAQVNFWKSHVAPIRVWGTVLKNEGFASAVRSRMGETYYKALTRMMKRVEAGGRLNAQQAMDFERVVKGLMRNFAVGTLGARVSTLMVNTSAVLNSTFEVPAGELLKGVSMVMKRPQAFADAWNSPPIQRRLANGASFEAQLAKSKGPSDNPVLAVLNRAAEPAMNAINFVDTTANTVGAVAAWEYHRNAALRANLNPEQAKRMADEKVETILRRTAQPTTRISKSEIELLVLDNPMSALLAMFISEPRKNMAIIFMAARKVITGIGSVSKTMAAQQLVMGLVAYTMAEFFLRSLYSAFFQAKPEDEDEAWKRLTDKLTDPKAIANKLAVSHIGGIPILGQGWQYAMAKVFDQPAFDDSNNPFVRTAKALEKIATVADTEKTASERIDGMLKVVQGIGSAVPGGPVFSQAANLIDAATGLAESSGVNFSEASKVDRFKARFAAENKEITKLYGKADGDKRITAKKHNAQVESLVGMLQSLPKDEVNKILEAINVSDEVASRVKRRLGK